MAARSLPRAAGPAPAVESFERSGESARLKFKANQIEERKVNMFKTGWKTSEFWLAIGGNAVLVLSMLGVFQTTDTSSVQDAWAKVVGGVFAVITNAVYIYSRTRIKSGGAGGIPPIPPIK